MNATPIAHPGNTEAQGTLTPQWIIEKVDVYNGREALGQHGNLRTRMGAGPTFPPLTSPANADGKGEWQSWPHGVQKPHITWVSMDLWVQWHLAQDEGFKWYVYGRLERKNTKRLTGLLQAGKKEQDKHIHHSSFAT